LQSRNQAKRVWEKKITWVIAKGGESTYVTGSEKPSIGDGRRSKATKVTENLPHYGVVRGYVESFLKTEFSKLERGENL